MQSHSKTNSNVERARQLVVRHLDERFEVIYQDKPAVSIPYDEAPWSAVSRALVALGFEVTDKREGK